MTGSKLPAPKLNAILGLFLVSLPLTASAGTVSLEFDNLGPEAGITTPGTTNFTFNGSMWSGGVVASVGNPGLYASGAFSYMVSMTGEVIFTTSATTATFFYVSASPATATAYAGDGSVLATVTAGAPAAFGAPQNFRTLTASQPIARIEFAGGVIDNFCFDPGPPPSASFLRGDINDDSAVNIADPIELLSYLFQNGLAPVCTDAADTNDDGGLDLSDVIFVLTFLFSNGPAPAAPGPAMCGTDPTVDSLATCNSMVCP